MSKKKKIIISLIALVGTLAILFGGFYIYTLDYYRADDFALQMFSSNTATIETLGDMIVFHPINPPETKTGLIFYPGGKVEAAAYVPLLKKISQEGITCVLITMPFNLAVFDVNAADKVFDKFPDIQEWYLGGHSLGGAMASSYVKNKSDKLEGLILLGAYPINDSDIPTIAIYGSEDLGLDKSKLEETENKLEIAGGNHAYFGNYGEQKGDGTASITREYQQTLTVEALVDFMN